MFVTFSRENGWITFDELWNVESLTPWIFYPVLPPFFLRTTASTPTVSRNMQHSFHQTWMKQQLRIMQKFNFIIAGILWRESREPYSNNRRWVRWMDASHCLFCPKKLAGGLKKSSGNIRGGGRRHCRLSVTTLRVKPPSASLRKLFSAFLYFFGILFTNNR